MPSRECLACEQDFGIPVNGAAPWGLQAAAIADAWLCPRCAKAVEFVWSEDEDEWISGHLGHDWAWFGGALMSVGPAASATSPASR